VGKEASVPEGKKTLAGGYLSRASYKKRAIPCHREQRVRLLQGHARYFGVRKDVVYATVEGGSLIQSPGMLWKESPEGNDLRKSTWGKV